MQFRGKMNAQTKWFFIVLLGVLMLSKIALALPTAPILTYVSNTTATSGMVNRSDDAKGTITTITLDANQQDYKWKAYVGNVTGKVALDNANGQSIYDWDLGATGGGEIYVSRFSNVDWANIACVNESVISDEEAGIGISNIARDNINNTFNYTTHRGFDVGTTPVSSCRSTATYINDTAQEMSSSALFQEILLMDATNGRLIYSTLMEADQAGYDNEIRDFQLLVAENESATVPTTYYFWVELGS